MDKVKKIRIKLAEWIQILFGYGIMICLFGGGLLFFGYLLALIVGGETATAICTLIYKTIYPYLIRLSTVLILLGLVKMYLCGEIALSGQKNKK